jgi:F420-non-reducing hydrogenase iron-sulfur subunit
MEAFEPRIVGLCCNWCSYTGADLAGVSRMKYPSNIRVVRVMCSGRVAPEFVIKALSLGADGVLVLGCHIGDCHYLRGNHFAKKRIALLKNLLDYLGMDSRRLRLDWVSASEGQKFAETIAQFTEQIRELGPSPLRGRPLENDRLKHEQEAEPLTAR